LNTKFSFLGQILGIQSDSDENSSRLGNRSADWYVTGVLKELAASIFRVLQEQGLGFSGDRDSTENTLMMDTASSSENSVTIHRSIQRHLTTLESSYAFLFIDV
jgi:hypothetical protein